MFVKFFRLQAPFYPPLDYGVAGDSEEDVNAGADTAAMAADYAAKMDLTSAEYVTVSAPTFH